MKFFTIETIILRQRTAERVEPLQRVFAALVPIDLQFAIGGDGDLDVVARFQFERVDNRLGQTHRQAVAPFRDLHDTPRGYTMIQYITWGSVSPRQPRRERRR